MEGDILHVHSTYSLHDSVQTPDEIVTRAKELGVKSITLTDHGTLLGIPAFMDAGKKYGINTIPGCEFYIENREHLLVIAKDYKGYQSISKALRDAWKHQVQAKNKKWYPVLTNELMEKHFSGNTHVIATTACIGGPISYILLANMRKEKKQNVFHEKAADLKDYYDDWCKYNQKYQELSAKIATLKAELKEYKPYLSKAYTMELGKEKREESQLFFDFEEAKIRDSGDLIKQKESLIENAKAITIDIEHEIKETTVLKNQIKKKADQLKSKKQKYETLIDQATQITFTDESILYQEAKNKLKYLDSIFPDFYIELQNHGIKEEQYVMPILAQLASELEIPVIAANDAHILDQSDDAIRGRQIIRYNYFQKAENVTEADKEMYIKSPDELYKAMCGIVREEIALQALNNTMVLEQCHVVFPKETHYPAIKNGEEEFNRLVAERRQNMIDSGDWDDIHESRYQHEIQVIKTMGYVDYHLIVRDFCNMARKLGVIPKSEIENIPNDFHNVDEWIKKKGFSIGIGVGPGRGSAVGSLICYLLGITNIDPLKYDLLFERYLNPERVTMPDIDSDIKTSLRPELIRYIKWKYGENAVCSIVTEGTYGAKSALQMAARNLASEKFDKNITLDKKERERKKSEFSKLGYQMSDLVTGDCLKDFDHIILKQFPSDEEKQILHDAHLIEGKLSSTSTHAGGIIISDNDDVCDHIPLHWVEENQVWASQCDMIKAEEFGMLKMDLLGLITEDLISDCLQLIKKHKGIDINIDRIQEEPEVFREIYAKGNTNSVFQFESEGMKQTLRKLQPESIADLILLNACFRPGPLQYLDDIIQVKNTGIRKESCLTKIPELQPILASTYGYPVYQEQVMQIFQTLAGYSLGSADLVRRAMSKKKVDKLEIERQAFLYGDKNRNIVGCEENGIDVEQANMLFDQLMDFAKYGFNKSHAAAYTIVSYQTAWLKYHYPVEFICSMFENEERSDYGKIMDDCETFGIKVLPPDINRSFFDFTIEDGKIRFGFCGIKGIANRDAVNRFVVGNSHKVAPYQSLTDFLIRNRNEEGSFLDKRMIEALIMSGCFDSLLPDREKAYELYNNHASLKKESSSFLQERLASEESFLLETSIKDSAYNIEQEEMYLGASISEDPLEDYPDDLNCNCIPMNNLKNGKGSVYGYVTKLSFTTSKAGRDMMILSLKGKHGKMSAYCIGNSYKKYCNNTNKWMNSVVRVYGSIKNESIFVESLSYMSKEEMKFYLRIDSENKAKCFLDACRKYQGEEANFTLIMNVSVGNPDGQYVQISPRLIQRKVSESVIQETGAVQYNLS